MGQKVLIIDDEKIFCRMLEGWLSDSGYTVFSAHNSQTGLEILAQENPDLILVDILLPGQSGIELCEELKKRDTKVHIPIVMMSGIYKEFTLSKQLKSVSNAFIQKPFKKEELMAVIDKVLIGEEDKTMPEHLYEKSESKKKKTDSRDSGEKQPSLKKKKGSQKGVTDILAELEMEKKKKIKVTNTYKDNTRDRLVQKELADLTQNTSSKKTK